MRASMSFKRDEQDADSEGRWAIHIRRGRKSWVRRYPEPGPTSRGICGYTPAQPGGGEVDGDLLSAPAFKPSSPAKPRGRHSIGNRDATVN
ncbi:unnamed protein product [Lota lota]